MLFKDINENCALQGLCAFGLQLQQKFVLDTWSYQKKSDFLSNITNRQKDKVCSRKGTQRVRQMSFFNNTTETLQHRTVLPASHKGEISDCCTREIITFLVYHLYSGFMNNRKNPSSTHNYILDGTTKIKELFRIHVC